MYCASHAARAGWTRPFSSVARLCSKARSPFHCHGSRKRVTLFEKTGSCSAASRQLAPPSAETSTLETFPAHADARLGDHRLRAHHEGELARLAVGGWVGVLGGFVLGLHRSVGELD